MLEKQIIHGVLSRIRRGALKVSYWDGATITYGKDKPSVHLTFKSARAVRAIIKNLTLGFGEGYMDGKIEVDGPLDHLMRIMSENADAFNFLALSRLPRIAARNIRQNQASQIQHHYDLGNDFYKLWLDKSMTYSCAYFNKKSDTLEKAQSQKVEHVLRKLQLQKGQRLLDIGSGWGTLALRAAEEYGVKVVGITLSREQLRHSNEEAKRRKLDKLVRFELANYQDYAEKGEQFDRIVSVGMYEHVGRKNQHQYFAAVEKMLKPDGISVLHTIMGYKPGGTDPWIDKYIFPGGHLPTVTEVTETLPKHQFHLVDFESLRMHYAMTLDEWWSRFERNKSRVIKMYDERFYRMWRLYLASCSGGFRYGDLDIGQFVFTKGLNNDLPLTREFLYKS